MRQRHLALVAVLAALLALLAVPGTAFAHDGSTLLVARLSGANEVPPADPDGSGTAFVLVQHDRACFAESWKDIAAPVASHIHAAAAGVNGPVVVPFYAAADGLPATLSSAAGCVAADPALLAAIAANPSQYYVNIHTAEFPAGAIRGQLHRTRHLDLDLPGQLRARLRGANEVPPADPDGSGLAFVSARHDEVCFALIWRNIAPPVASHIHSGVAGVNGPVVVPFFAVSAGLPASLFAVDGCIHGVDRDLVRDIARHPGRYYVNIHTAEFPAGAIRGQLHH